MSGKGRKAAIGWVVALALALTAGVSFGHDMRHRGDGDGPEALGPFPGKAMDRLGVTVEQKTRIRDILEKHRPEAKPVVTQLMAERRTLRHLVQEGTSDEAAIRGQASRVASLEADMAVLRARVSRELRAVLTPEQAAKLAEFRERRERKADRDLERRFREKEGEKP